MALLMLQMMMTAVNVCLRLFQSAVMASCSKLLSSEHTCILVLTPEPFRRRFIHAAYMSQG